MFCLVVGYDAKYMSGLFFTYDISGKIIASPWILGRDEDSLTKAEARIILTISEINSFLGLPPN